MFLVDCLKMITERVRLLSQFSFAASLLVASACTTQVKIDDPSAITTLSIEEVTYDTTNATLNIKGKNFLHDQNPLTVFKFYSDSSCASTTIGEGTQANFEAEGIHITAPSTVKTTIYVATNTNANCTMAGTYDPLHLAPPAPTFTEFSPSSPTRLTTTPRILGTTGGVTLNLGFYSDAACTVAIGAGVASEFTTNGITLTVSPNADTSVYVIAKEPFGNASPCSLIKHFIHTTVIPAAPVLTGTVPVSPSGQSITPSIRGTTDANTTKVNLFSDATCLTKIGTGSADEFKNTGITATVSANVSTTIWAIAMDAAENASPCNVLTTYVHDDVAPAVPTYATSNPLSPTGATLYPKIIGTAPSDAVSVNLYKDRNCINQIGSGTRAVFEDTGVNVSILANDTVSIYARSIDVAENPSACQFMTDYTSDTIPPDVPVFAETNPTSPTNKSITPKIIGGVSVDTDHVALFKNSTCTQQIGTDTAAVFQSTGIQVSVTGNTATGIYGISYDAVGNPTDCTYLTTYDHSTAIPPGPTLTTTSPTSPTNQVVSGAAKPFLIGTLSNVIISVQFFSDNACSVSIGTGTASAFKSAGVRVTLPLNAVSPIYSVAYDKYGNESNCNLLTNFTHTNITPQVPTYSAFTPASPTKVTDTPLISGTASNVVGGILPTSTVKFYDSPFCVNNIGTGTQAAFSTGILVNMGRDTTTNIYAKTFDAAGNASACTFMADFTHDTLLPGRPLFASALPGTPSFSNITTIIGTIASNVDILPATKVSLYADDPTCSVNLLGNSVPNIFTTVGIQVTLTKNVNTKIYGATTNQVGTDSTCQLLIDFQHTDAGPSSLSATANANGSIGLAWLPDTVARPLPTYTVRRSSKIGGPYAVIASGLGSTSYRDSLTSNNSTYYYVVTAQNSTGNSLDSTEASASVAVSAPSTPTALVAAPGPEKVTLSWATAPTDLAYHVYRSITKRGPYTRISSDLTVNQYIDLSLTNDTPYYYVVTAINPAGESGISNEASAVPKGLPPAPTNLKAAFVTDPLICTGLPFVRLTWSAPSYYNKFNIHFASDGSGREAIIATVNAQTYDVCVAQLDFAAPDFDQYFQVSADWGGQGGATSSEVVVYNVATDLTAHPGNNEVYLTWDFSGTLTHFAIKRASKAGGPYTLLTTVTGTSTYVDTTAVNGNAYYYVVTPQMNIGSNPARDSNEVMAVPAPNPSAPSNLTLTVNNNVPTLQWSAPANYDSFNVYTAPAAGGPWTLGFNIANPAVSNYTDSMNGIGRTYYKVSALWGSSYETAASNVVSFRNGVTSSISATVMTNTTVKITWGAVAGASSYTLKRSNTLNGTYTNVSTSAVSPYTDTVTTNTGYYYLVTAAFADGTTGQSSAIVKAMPGTGSVPSGVTVASFNNSSVTLDWPTVVGATSYKVYYGTTNNGPYPLSTTSTTPTKTVSGLNSNTMYYFKVTATKGGESAQSSQVSALTVSPTNAPTVTPGSTTAQIDWSGTAGASSYTVQRSTDNTTFSTLTSGLTSYTYNDTGLTNGQIYFYRIGAVFSNGTLYSSSSSPVTPGITPSVPDGITATGNTNGTDLFLTWSSVTGATNYNIYTVVTGVYTIYGTTNSSVNYNVTALTEGSPVSFAVTALNGSNESGYSPTYTFVPLTTPAAPTVSMTAANTATISWSTVSGAASYDVARSLDSVNFNPLANSVAALSYNDTTVLSGQAYFYRFTPVFAGGARGSDSAMSLPVTPINALLPPSTLTATASGTTSIVLDWIPSPAAVSYNIYVASVTGGPYSFLTNVTAPTTTYTDTSVTAGNDYYYVVTSVNDSNVNSAYSNESGVTLGSTPTGLAGVVTNGNIQLSWNAVAGATAYTLNRSTSAVGPFSAIYSGTALTYGDTTIKNGVTYYYTINASFASGIRSNDSSTISKVGQFTMDLQVPIELTDQGMASSTVAHTFERSQTYLDPSAYDGTLTYDLEVVATNTDSSSGTVSLLDSFDANSGSVSVPANTTIPTRIRTTITALTSTDFYRIQLGGTTSGGDLKVYSARLWITQNGASKTKLYIPLLSTNASPSTDDQIAKITSSTTTTYGAIAEASYYTRNTSALSLLDPTNPWELETVVAASTGEVGAVALYNITQDTAVPFSEVFFNETLPTLSNISLSDNISKFDSTNEGDQYRIAIRCFANCSNGVFLYKAGLWVTLTELSKAEVIIRNSLGNLNVGSTTDLDDSRTLINTALYSNPTFYFQATAKSSALGSSLDVQLMDSGNLDSGTGSLSAVAGSTLNFSSTQYSTARSSAITITSGNRFITETTPVGLNGSLTHSAIVIDVAR